MLGKRDTRQSVSLLRTTQRYQSEDLGRSIAPLLAGGKRSPARSAKNQKGTSSATFQATIGSKLTIKSLGFSPKRRQSCFSWITISILILSLTVTQSAFSNSLNLCQSVQNSDVAVAGTHLRFCLSFRG